MSSDVVNIYGRAWQPDDVAATPDGRFQYKFTDMFDPDGGPNLMFSVLSTNTQTGVVTEFNLSNKMLVGKDPLMVRQIAGAAEMSAVSDNPLVAPTTQEEIDDVVELARQALDDGPIDPLVASPPDVLPQAPTETVDVQEEEPEATLTDPSLSDEDILDLAVNIIVNMEKPRKSKVAEAMALQGVMEKEEAEDFLAECPQIIVARGGWITIADDIKPQKVHPDPEVVGANEDSEIVIDPALLEEAFTPAPKTMLEFEAAVKHIVQDILRSVTISSRFVN